MSTNARARLALEEIRRTVGWTWKEIGNIPSSPTTLSEEQVALLVSMLRLASAHAQTLQNCLYGERNPNS